MGNLVFANMRAVCHKGSSGKSVASMPDVCLSPPPPPAGPVPVPYPNTAMASDLADGSKDTFVQGNPICLSDKSCFSKSSGDEGGTQGGGLLSHKTQGKVYFSSWSMDVKVEGEGVCRHLDMVMHNAASFPRNTPTWPYLDSLQVVGGVVVEGPCKGVDTKFMLVPYSATTGRRNKRKNGGKTGHHLIPDRCFHGKNKGNGKYSKSTAPTLLVRGRTQHDLEHAAIHAIFDALEAAHSKRGKPFTYKAACDAAAISAKGLNNNKPLTDKELKCIKLQLSNHYKDGCGYKDEDVLQTSGYQGKNVAEGKKAVIEDLSISTSTVMKNFKAV
jgi:hypothetical protein